MRKLLQYLKEVGSSLNLKYRDVGNRSPRRLVISGYVVLYKVAGGESATASQEWSHGLEMEIRRPLSGLV